MGICTRAGAGVFVNDASFLRAFGGRGPPHVTPLHVIHSCGPPAPGALLCRQGYTIEAFLLGGLLRECEGRGCFGRVKERFCRAKSNRVGNAGVLCGPGASLTQAAREVPLLSPGGGWPHWDSLSRCVPSTFLMTKKHTFMISMKSKRGGKR